MTKFHISNNGETVECHAQPGQCPKKNSDGTTQRHFNSKSEAEQYIFKNKTSHGLRKKLVKVNLEPKVEQAINDLSNVGKPYVVGGVVRDALVGSDSKDVDIEVHESDLDKITQHLIKRGYKVDEVGRDFGVLKVSKGDLRDLDVSVPRKENRVGKGHRDFEVETNSSMTLQEAAERRDFTFNAIMYDPQARRTVDPTNGVSDFRNKTMRHVSEKFSEDPLRVIRGFQFAGRFDLTYDPNTANLCQGLRNEYDSIPEERVREEWGKFYSRSQKPRKGVHAIQDSGWDDTIPGLRESLQNSDTLKSLDKLPDVAPENRKNVGASLIARNMDEDNKRHFLMATLPTKKDAIQSESMLALSQTDLSTYEKRAWASRKHTNGFQKLEEYAYCIDDAQLQKNAHHAKNEGILDGPPKDVINGNEVCEVLNRKPGKWVGQALHSLRKEQYSGRITTQESAKSFLKQHKFE